MPPPLIAHCHSPLPFIFATNISRKEPFDDNTPVRPLNVAVPEKYPVTKTDSVLPLLQQVIPDPSSNEVSPPALLAHCQSPFPPRALQSNC